MQQGGKRSRIEGEEYILLLGRRWGIWYMIHVTHASIYGHKHLWLQAYMATSTMATPNCKPGMGARGHCDGPRYY
jgi:hypothetical protein